MSIAAQIAAQIAQAAAVGDNMTEAQKGGGGGRLLPVGNTAARLISYIELGKHPQEFGGKAKDPAPEIKLAFALYSPGYANEDGTPYIIRPFQFAVSRNEKSRAFKLFKTLNYKGTCTHFAQLLGEAFIVGIKQEPKSKTDPTLVSRIDFDSIRPPLDPLSGAPYAIPEYPLDKCELFLWDFPTKEQWDALYVDGKWDDGRSKNSVQEMILSALNFEGSPLQQLLFGANLALPSAPVAAVVAPQGAPSLPPGVGYAAPNYVAPAAPVMPSAPVVAPSVPFGPSAAIAAAPSIPAPAFSGAPVSLMTPATTFPSNPVAPALPAFPVPPALPQ